MKHGDIIYHYWYRWQRKKPLIYLFRYDPVPGIHKYHNGNYYRSPRTTQEKRWALVDKKYIRGKRSFRSLPDTWDDIHISSYGNKNWKKQSKKKKQWM